VETGAPLLEAMAVRIWPCLLAVAFVAAVWVSGASSVREQVRVGGLGFLSVWIFCCFSVQKMFVAVVHAMGNSDRMQKNDW
jgi:hypothetical protein